MILKFKLSSFFGSPMKSWKSDYNQSWVKDVIGVPSYVNEVKGHVELFLCELL